METCANILFYAFAEQWQGFTGLGSCTFKGIVLIPCAMEVFCLRNEADSRQPLLNTQLPPLDLYTSLTWTRLLLDCIQSVNLSSPNASRLQNSIILVRHRGDRVVGLLPHGLDAFYIHLCPPVMLCM